MELKELFTMCGRSAKEKGFTLESHATQLCLVATEVAEALDHVNTNNCGYETRMFIETLQSISFIYEQYRKDERISHEDNSTIIEHSIEDFLEELADTQIRIASYVGGNNFYEQFEDILIKKIEKNKNRPYLHGKQF